ncbi:cyclic-phosphate processing receiver domain-containing protein [Paludisphaera rhizosphaerae]|uniref:cyclic-phosphate processing receiver domain-containing protein n=1 Tax=Paludisphaera rhizosphaerae TaxID=2711216 RepID=UPI0013ECEF30|nr:cyclic-phosphate processing receiver domain-containing protein [Paludisphaera rhizosphaerae]
MIESLSASDDKTVASPPVPDSSPAVAAAPESFPDSPSLYRRVLFLDDDRRRAEVFLKRCPQAVWVLTAQDCISRLAESWDEIHLDHDLGGEKYVDVNRDDCGMAVVRWLCAEDRGNLRNARFFIHSYNFSAASLMVECLLQNGYTAEFRPFGFDLVDFLSFEPPPPPNHRRIAWRRLVSLWTRLTGLGPKRRSRVTKAPATRYDKGLSAAREASENGLGTAEPSENQP